MFKSVNARAYPETSAGGFTRYDGTVAFYTRINALLHPEMVAVDFGAGRGASSNDENEYRRNLGNLRGKVAHLIGLDIDEAVLENIGIDEGLVYDGTTIPLASASVDIIVSDWTLEHLATPGIMISEIGRILKPGGWFCARTPHLYSLLALASSMVPNRLHPDFLKRIQPNRKTIDVFPTRYKINSMTAIRRHFSKRDWENFTYTWSPEPSYHFNNLALLRLMQIYQYIKYPILGGECLFVFLRKI